MALLGGGAEPADSIDIALHDALALLVELAQANCAAGSPASAMPRSNAAPAIAAGDRALGLGEDGGGERRKRPPRKPRI